jgi:SAM-dependent methyltransferase
MALHPHAMGLFKSYARKSAALTSLASRMRGIRGMAGLAELDAFFRSVVGSGKEVTAEAMAKMMRVYLRIPRDPAFALDPFSPGYAEAQMRLYASVADKSYATANEATPFDFERDKDNFFPYNTRSGEFVGSQLLSHGFLIRNMNLKPGARIVEFGPGWGNTHMHLAMMGYETTAVEVNKPSIELMRYRAGLHGRTIRTVESDMVEFAKSTGDRFDAALFVGCFHHCHDPVGMIGLLDRILSEDGVVYFCEEPIFPSRSPAMPYPWGLRLDGNSLYYTRNLGWLEMGYQETFFREMLRRAGWNVETVFSTIKGVEDLYIARRSR